MKTMTEAMTKAEAMISAGLNWSVSARPIGALVLGTALAWKAP